MLRWRAALGRLELVGCCVLRSRQQAGCSFRLAVSTKALASVPNQHPGLSVVLSLSNGGQP